MDPRIFACGSELPFRRRWVRRLRAGPHIATGLRVRRAKPCVRRRTPHSVQAYAGAVAPASCSRGAEGARETALSRGFVPATSRIFVAANTTSARFVTTGGGATIDRAVVNATVSSQREGRHVLGVREYSGGSYSNSIDDAQRVLGDFHGGATEDFGVKGNGINVRGLGFNPFGG